MKLQKILSVALMLSAGMNFVAGWHNFTAEAGSGLLGLINIFLGAFLLFMGLAMWFNSQDRS